MEKPKTSGKEQNRLSLDWINVWQAVIRNSECAFSTLSGRGSWMFSVKQYLLSSLLVSVAVMTILAFLDPSTGDELAGLDFWEALPSLVFLTGLMIFGSGVKPALFLLFTFSVCRIFGGKGTLARHVFLTALFIVPVSLILMFGDLVVQLGRPFYFLKIAAAIPFFYWHTLAAKTAHGFSIQKAVAVVLVSIFLIWVALNILNERFQTLADWGLL